MVGYVGFGIHILTRVSGEPVLAGGSSPLHAKIDPPDAPCNTILV